MNLYVRRGISGNMGTVFHLEESCASSPEAHVYTLASEADVRHWRKTFGIRKICVKCRKAYGRKG